MPETAPLVAAIPGLRLGRGGNSRPAHWSGASRRAKRERRVARLCTQAAVSRYGGPARWSGQITVTITRVAPSGGLESDNLAGACKHVRDGIADALRPELPEQVRDDPERSGITWVCAQERGPWGVRAEIESGGMP